MKENNKQKKEICKIWAEAITEELRNDYADNDEVDVVQMVGDYLYYIKYDTLEKATAGLEALDIEYNKVINQKYTESGHFRRLSKEEQRERIYSHIMEVILWRVLEFKETHITFEDEEEATRQELEEVILDIENIAQMDGVGCKNI